MSEIKIPPIEPNSYKYNAERKNDKPTAEQTPTRLTPILSKNDLVHAKEGFGTKVKNLFFANTPQNLGSMIVKECIVPSVMKALWDGIQLSLFGKKTEFTFPTMTNYRDYQYRDYSRSYQSPYYNDDYTRTPYRNPTNSASGVNWRNLILQRPEDAERIVHTLWDCIRKDGKVSVGQLLDLFGVVGEFTDNNWGWKNERDIGIRTTPQGFLIDLAEPIYIN